MNQKELLEKLSDLLIEKKMTIATAESCTGGLIAHTLTNISGSSAYFDRGIISYSNQAKQDLLTVPEQLIIDHGAVSEEVAAAMAKGARENAHADIGLSTTGIAGPTGGSREKPVGLVYIGLSAAEQTKVRRHIFSGSRLENKEQFCATALTLLYEHLVSTS
jgi:nicotinamide-nucleotide amidase